MATVTITNRSRKSIGIAGIVIKPNQTRSVVDDANSHDEIISLAAQGLVLIDSAAASPREKNPILVWKSNSTVEVAPSVLGQEEIVMTLSDGIERSFPEGIYRVFNIIADLAQGTEAPSTWYYLYAVPPTGQNPFHLKMVGDTRMPDQGPMGYTASGYLGAIRNDANGNIIPFTQEDARFYYNTDQLAIDLRKPSQGTETVDLSAFVPETVEYLWGTLAATADRGTAGSIGLAPEGSTSFQSVSPSALTDKEPVA